MELGEMIEEARRLSRQLDNGLDVLRSTVEECAEAERQYRKAKALCWLEAEGRTAAEREAWVDSETADLRFERDVQDGLKRAAIESVRARAQQISLLQSMLSAHRSEAEFVRTAP